MNARAPLQALSPLVLRLIDSAEAPWDHERVESIAHALVAAAQSLGASQEHISAAEDSLERPDGTSIATAALAAMQPDDSDALPQKFGDIRPSQVVRLMRDSSRMEALLRHLELKRNESLAGLDSAFTARAYVASALFLRSRESGDLRFANSALKLVDDLRSRVPAAIARASTDAGRVLIAFALVLAAQEACLAKIEGRP